MNKAFVLKDFRNNVVSLCVIGESQSINFWEVCMNRKRFLKILTPLMCSGVIFLNSQTALADTTDKYYLFFLGQSAKYTEGYYKDNSTSVYVNPVLGPSGTMFAGFRYTSSGSWVNETIGQWAYIAAGTKRRLRTNIYENGGYQRTLCRLGGKLDTTLPPTHNIQVSGYWSPDTAGNYPAAN